MKSIVSILIILLAVIGCNSTKDIGTNSNNIASKKVSDTVKIANDSLEYEVNEITFVRTAVLPTELDIYTVLRGSFFNDSLKLICNNKVVFKN